MVVNRVGVNAPPSFRSSMSTLFFLWQCCFDDELRRIVKFDKIGFANILAKMVLLDLVMIFVCRAMFV